MKHPTLGVCYYPEHWPREMWADDARRMVEAGISVVRIGEFGWSRIEPARGAFQWDWLDDAIETLGSAGLSVVLGTPTATPPKWLVDEMPDMLAVDENGHRRGFGSRRHYCFSYRPYREECARIVTAIGERYGANDHVTAWQTDNEYGCHDTSLSYSDAARDAFREWLAARYGTVTALNEAWGNVFWSMEYASFNEVELPNLTVTEANPAHWLAFRRFASDEIVAFNRVQTDILRRLSPGRDLLHNFMGRETGFDHFDVSRDLDIATWDSYPLGFLERFGRDGHWKNWYLRAGDPDFQAFHHDLYRACTKDKRWWVIEQQPGPVNWADWNPSPHPGMVRAWCHEAFAHGAEVVSLFRWRQAPFAQEQMHTGLNRTDGAPDVGLAEVEQVGRELEQLPASETKQARVALMFDYPGQWATQIQSQGRDYDGLEITLSWYAALRRLGQSVDIIAPHMDVAGYDAIVVPHLPILDEDTASRLATSSAQVLFGPRTGSRTAEHLIPDALPPGPIQVHLPMLVERVESLRPGIRVPAGRGHFMRWFEHVRAGDSTDVVLRDEEDRPAIVRKGGLTYMAGWPDDDLLMAQMRALLERADVPAEETGDDLRVRDRGALRTIVNYGPKPVDASHLLAKGDTILVGSKSLPVAGVLIAQRAR